MYNLENEVIQDNSLFRKFKSKLLNILFYSVITFSSASINAQNYQQIIAANSQVHTPKIEWERSFKGEEDEPGKRLSREAKSVQQTNDGGYIIAGNFCIKEMGNQICLTKIDSNGNIEWERTFIGEKIGFDHHYPYSEAKSVQQTRDGGYVIAGQYGRPTQLFDAYFSLIKTNSIGDVEWRKEFNPSESTSEAKFAQQTEDSGYVIIGDTALWAGWPRGGRVQCPGSIYIVKTIPNGEKKWEKIFAGNLFSEDGEKYRQDLFVNSGQQTRDGGYIIVGGRTWGYSRKKHKRDIHLVKINSKGDKEWDQIFESGEDDYASSIRQTRDGGYIIAGDTRRANSKRKFLDFKSASDVYLIKIDSNGNKEWEKFFGNENYYDSASSVEQTKEGGYIIAGSTKSFGDNLDVTRSIKIELDGKREEEDGGYSQKGYLIKTDSKGNKEWEAILGGKIYPIPINNSQFREQCELNSVQQTEDGGYVAVGRMEREFEDKSSVDSVWKGVEYYRQRIEWDTYVIKLK